MLKIGKLPDRTPVKITISVMPDIYDLIQDYCKVYEVEYGQAETPQSLIPAMLEAFIQSDHRFKKARQKLSSVAADKNEYSGHE